LHSNDKVVEGPVPLDGEEGGEGGGQRAREHAAQGRAAVAQRDGHVEGRPLGQIRIAGWSTVHQPQSFKMDTATTNQTQGGGHLMAKS
jgi:hypothetical protein